MYNAKEIRSAEEYFNQKNYPNVEFNSKFRKINPSAQFMLDCLVSKPWITKIEVSKDYDTATDLITYSAKNNSIVMSGDIYLIYRYIDDNYGVNTSFEIDAYSGPNTPDADLNPLGIKQFSFVPECLMYLKKIGVLQ